MKAPRLTAVAAAALLVLVVLVVPVLGAVLIHRPDSVAQELPEPQPGMRWVSYLDVAVQVPEDWGYGFDPGDQWCVGNEDAQAPDPYVDTSDGHGASSLVGCLPETSGAPAAFGPAPESTWADHVALESSSEGRDVQAAYDGWTLSSRTVGDVRVRLLSDDPAATAGILDSARTIEGDANGCPVTSAIQAVTFQRPDHPFDVTTIRAVDGISVCQYDRTLGRDHPALVASWRMEGQQAADLLAGLQSAPEGSGPNTPDNCMADDYGDMAVDLRLDAGVVTHEVYLYYESCIGNGTDDGTTQRRLTKDTCGPVFRIPVMAWQFQALVCIPPKPQRIVRDEDR